MAIYRGPGGPGDATADQASTAQLAQTFASQAAASASSASTSAANAATSASEAAASASAVEDSATAAAASASSAATSATNAANSATNATTAETNASESANDAAASEAAAEGFKDDAEAAKIAAEAAQAAAETAQANAETAETGALAAQSAAESARDSALAAYDNFDDRYLGAKASDPALDNDGNALIAGALYFNTADNAMRVYTGTIWVDAYAAGSTFLAKANNLSDLTNVATARQNLDLEIGVDVQAYSSVLQGTTASFTTADETKLDGIEAGADVTDATNVAAAGAIMDGDFSTNGLMKRTGSGTYSVVTDNSSNWDTAYGWGNHASAGYLTSYTETDPIVGAINGIVKANGSGTISAAVAGTDYLTTAVTSATAGTGISVSSSTGSVTITNTAPDQTVSLTGSGATSISGTYPNFTISSTDTNTTYTAGTGLTLAGTTFSNTDLGSSQNIFKNIDVAGQSSIVADSNNDTLTIVAGTGINLATDATTDTLTITNSSPDQTVAISSGTGISVSGTYPNFTVAATNNGTVTSVGLSAPTGFSVADSPVTGSGTLALSFSSGYSLPTTTSQSNWDTAYGWGDHAAQNYLDSADIGSNVQAYDSNLTSFVSAFTLPTTDGSNGQVLTTNGSGTLSFTTASGGGGITTGKAIAMAIVFG